MTPPARSSAVAALLIAFMSGGCIQPSAPRSLPPPPPVPLEQTVAAINDNNSKIQEVWAKGQLNIQYEGKKYPQLKAILMYEKPRNFALSGSHMGEQVRICSNEHVFWAWIKQADQGWVGRYDQLERANAEEFGLRPDHLLEVMAIDEIVLDPFEDPFVVQEIYPDVITLDTVVATPDGDLVAHKRVELDRRSLKPRSVKLFGRDGVLLLDAELSDHGPIGDATMARRYDLTWPTLDIRMQLKLTTVEPKLRTSNRDVFKYDRPRVQHIHVVTE